MPRLTLGDVKTSRLPYAVNLCGTQNESKLTALVNEAQERLLAKGKWVGTYGRYRISVDAGCITWPRQIGTIEAWAYCEGPGRLRNEWYEFQECGPGLQDSENNRGSTMIDRGEACTYANITVTGNRIAVRAEHASDAGKKIILKYYTSTGVKVLTQIDGTWQEGEEITIVAPPAYALSANAVLPNGLYSVLKDTTNQPVSLWLYDPSAGAIGSRIALYEPSETRPVYRRSQVPGLDQFSTCTDDDCEDQRTVTVIAKFRHIPVVNDNDELLIGNLPALKLACQSILYEEQERLDLARTFMHGGTIVVDGNAVPVDGAIPLLEQELAAWIGDGVIHTPRMCDTALYWGGGIENIIS